MVGTGVPVKGLEEKLTNLTKERGLKEEKYLDVYIVNLVLTKSMRSIQSDVNKNLVLTIKN